MLEVAAGAAEERHLSNIIFRHGYAEKLPFEDASFEVVINRYSAHHWYDVGQALREVNRVLKPGGALIIMDIMLQDILYAIFGCKRWRRYVIHRMSVTIPVVNGWRWPIKRCW